jgi:hypothetical protein
MDLITIRLPRHLINDHAIWWYGDTANFVLNDDVIDWLMAESIIPSLKIVHQKRKEPQTGDEIQYDLIFNSVREATLFKLRWF